MLTVGNVWVAGLSIRVEQLDSYTPRNKEVPGVELDLQAASIMHNRHFTLSGKKGKSLGA